MTVKGGNKCNNWPDFPIGVLGATGGLIGNTVIICGGRDSNYVADECYTLTSDKATLVTNMFVGRAYASSIVLNDKTLWVTGGYYNENLLWKSTEYVAVTGTIIGPDLPMALASHAMVAINSTCSMVIGGRDENYVSSASTFYYERNEGEWITGPCLMQARDGHAAGIVTDEVTDEHFVAVTGGIYSFDPPLYLDSSEILQDREWVQGTINQGQL